MDEIWYRWSWGDTLSIWHVSTSQNPRWRLEIQDGGQQARKIIRFRWIITRKRSKAVMNLIIINTKWLKLEFVAKFSAIDTWNLGSQDTVRFSSPDIRISGEQIPRTCVTRNFLSDGYKKQNLQKGSYNTTFQTECTVKSILFFVS